MDKHVRLRIVNRVYERETALSVEASSLNDIAEIAERYYVWIGQEGIKSRLEVRDGEAYVYIDKEEKK